MEIDLTHGNLQIITDEIVRYQYEGNDSVNENSGIIEFDLSILDEVANHKQDYSAYTIECILNKTIRIIKVCNNPSYLGDNTDIVALSLMRSVFNDYIKNDVLPKNVISISRNLFEKMKQHSNDPNVKQLIDLFESNN